MAKNRRWVYFRLKLIESGSRGRGHRATPLTPQIRARVRVEGHTRVLDDWKRRLESFRELDPGLRTRTLLLPMWNVWLHRGHGETGFHLTQILSGHDCFNAFLARIGRLDSSRCAHCAADFDDVEHTLLHCPEWTNYRVELEAAIGEFPLSLENSIVRAILNSENCWNRVVPILDHMMRDKESAEARQGVRS